MTEHVIHLDKDQFEQLRRDIANADTDEAIKDLVRMAILEYAYPVITDKSAPASTPDRGNDSTDTISV